MVTLPATLIMAVSFAPGTTPPVQLAAVSQSPPAGLSQLIVAGASRSSSNSQNGRQNRARTARRVGPACRAGPEPVDAKVLPGRRDLPYLRHLRIPARN